MRKAIQVKQKIVDNFVKLMNEFPIVGAVDMESLPAPQLQVMKGQLRDTVTIMMAKKRVIF